MFQINVSLGWLRARDGQWNDSEPADHLHAYPDGTHCLRIETGHSGDTERKVCNDRADPAYRRNDVHGEGELANTGRHDHDWCTPYATSRVGLPSGQTW